MLSALVAIGLMKIKNPNLRGRLPDNSLIQLIANPKKYHKKQVTVSGFLQIEFEGDALYFHQEDAQFMITENAVWVELSDEMRTNSQKFNNKYVSISGVFNAKENGHFNMFSGTIEDVSSCRLKL